MTYRILKWLALLPFAALLVLLGLFWFNEHRREILIEQYFEASKHVVDYVGSKKSGFVGELLVNTEVLVCAIGGYGSVDRIDGLTNAQRRSLDKEYLPVIEEAWYLLFFSPDSISRILLIDSEKMYASMGNSGAGCVDGVGWYRLIEVQGDHNRTTLTFGNLNEGSG